MSKSQSEKKKYDKINTSWDESADTLEVPLYETRIWTSSINVYKGPGINHEIVKVLGRRRVFTIVKECGGQGALKWGKLDSGEEWIPLDFTEWLNSNRNGLGIYPIYKLSKVTQQAKERAFNP